MSSAPAMTDKLKLATGALHVLTAFYVGVGVWMLSRILESSDRLWAHGTQGLLLAIGFVSLLLPVAFQVIARGVRRRRQWSWIAGLIAFGLFVVSPLLPVAATGLYGLLAQGSREALGVRLSPPEGDAST